jgi:hypothetical protein
MGVDDPYESDVHHEPLGGKLLCGVRVVNRDTYKPIGPMASCLRNLPLWIPFMIFWVAFRLMRGYRTGDRWSGSKVIWRKYASHPVFTGLAVCVGMILAGLVRPSAGTGRTCRRRCGTRSGRNRRR